MDTNVLHCGDNLTIMEGMEDECVDLIYADPPYFTQKDWGDFDDRFDSMDDYIEFMRARLVEMHRVLKPTGSIYIHLDWHASHYIKVMMDGVFGYDHFQNDIIWCYSGAGRSKNAFAKKHDNILVYNKSSVYTFNTDDIRVPYNEGGGAWQAQKSGKPMLKPIGKSMHSWKPSDKGKVPEDWWTIPFINPMSKERLGYPTQKPEALIERIIKASSNPDDIVLDPFCGSGTSLFAAHTLGRRYIGIDQNPRAIEISRSRLDVPVQQTL